MTDSLKTVRTVKASTHKPYADNPVQTPARADMVKNTDGGGYVFKIDAFEKAQRFLILGSESNFYRSGAEMSKNNAKNLFALAENDESSRKLVDMIVEVSTSGRAPKQNPALFALAVASSFGSAEAKSYALSKLPAVARTASALYLFVGYVTQFRKWGRGLKRGVSAWFTEKPVDKLAFQAVKYRQRDGWTLGDVARLAHPSKDDAAFDGLMKWVLRGDTELVPTIVQGFVKAQEEGADIPALVREYGLSWEMLPTQALNDIKVWEALFETNLPLGALIRQLPRLTRIGFFPPLGGQTAAVVARLTDVEELRRARIHPINILAASKTYSSGRSVQGNSTWVPNQKIVDALDDAFYLAFQTVEPTGKNFMLGVDVSYSMTWGAGTPGGLAPYEVAAALSLVTAATEENVVTYGFSRTIQNLGISPKMRLPEALKRVQKADFSSTNPGALIEKAIKENIPVDAFVIITDNEVNTGKHVFELLNKYRAKSGRDTKLIVLGVTASDFTLADPNDKGSLGIAGMDASTPTLISDFVSGRV